MILTFNEKVKELEHQNKWNEVFELLHIEWEEDKTNINNFLCLGTEIWFILVFYERLRIKIIDKNLLYEKLKELKNYGFEKFENQKYFNAIFGYMIKVMPYLFIDDGTAVSYDEWQKKGEEMIRKAYLKEKSNPFFAALYFCSIYDEEKMKDSCRLFTQVKNEFFSEDEEVGAYFIRILSC